MALSSQIRWKRSNKPCCFKVNSVVISAFCPPFTLISNATSGWNNLFAGVCNRLLKRADCIWRHAGWEGDYSIKKDMVKLPWCSNSRNTHIYPFTSIKEFLALAKFHVAFCLIRSAEPNTPWTPDYTLTWHTVDGSLWQQYEVVCHRECWQHSGRIQLPAGLGRCRHTLTELPSADRHFPPAQSPR